MKVLLVYPDFEISLEHGTRRFVGVEQGGWYSEGLASLSAVLKREGHKVSLYHLVRPPEKREFVARIREEEPDLIGFSSLTRSFPSSVDMAAWTKAERDIPIVMGGYHATHVPEDVVAVPQIDAVCRGEGEYPLLELIGRLEESQPFHDVPGLWVRTADGIVRNGPGGILEDPDKMPMPDYGLFDFSKLQASKIRTAIVLLSRGCPYSCTYCPNKRTRQFYGKSRPPIRFPSPEVSIARLEHLREVFPDVRYINFRDDILPWQGGWLDRFAHLYVSRINLPFNCNFRANLLTPRIVKTLKEMGCYQVFFGVESGNDRIRGEVLNRHMTREQIVAAFEACHSAGIATVAYNMIGLPFEDRGCILDTIKLNAEIKAGVSLNPAYHPFPGTDLFDVAVAEGFVPRGFDYREDRYLEQPTLSLVDLRFALKYFKTFVRLYRRAYSKPPGPARDRHIRFLDGLYLSPGLPRRALTGLADWRDRLLGWTKGALLARAPRVYLFLRDRLRGVRTRRAEAA